VTVLDAEDFDWTGVDPSLRTPFSAAIFGTLLRDYAEGLAEYRGHPLSVRRYMWKMDY
jgi:fructoselysine 6-phosphate deglycase